ncbi:hypothetical protein [Streptomyces chartreusis]|uniref:hypothetical protein n=1 Tax=Streptomyces chartreusis TaxID=1969 RepID=UPI003802E9B9
MSSRSGRRASPPRQRVGAFLASGRDEGGFVDLGKPGVGDRATAKLLDAAVATP